MFDLEVDVTQSAEMFFVEKNYKNTQRPQFASIFFGYSLEKPTLAFYALGLFTWRFFSIRYKWPTPTLLIFFGAAAGLDLYSNLLALTQSASTTGRRKKRNINSLKKPESWCATWPSRSAGWSVDSIFSSTLQATASGGRRPPFARIYASLWIKFD